MPIAAAAVLVTGGILLLLFMVRDAADGGVQDLIRFSDSFEDITQEVANSGTYVFSQSETKELLVHADSTVSVRDRESGRVYTTTLPSDSSTYSGDSTENQSLFSLEYLNETSRKETINSFTESVEKEQYRIFRNGESLRIEYILGENLAEEIYPTIISKDRFEKDVLEKLGDSDREFLLRNYFLFTLDEIEDEQEKKNILLQYPALETQDIYVLSAQVNKRIQSRLVEIFQSVSYTYEDYLRDNAENQVAVDSAPLTFRIAVEFTLDGDDLLIRIPKEDLVFYEDYPLTKLSLHKFFTAVSGEEGTLFLPSGSGALISLENSTGVYGSHTLPVYSDNKSIRVSERKNMNKPEVVTLPVYGSYSGGQGMLTIIEGAAATASLQVVSSRQAAYVYPEFTVLENDEARLTGSSVSYTCGSELLNEDILVRHVFFEEEHVDYATFANYYRSYLEERGILNSSVTAESPLLVCEWIGSVGVEKQLDNWQYTKEVTLSTFDQMTEMTRYFTQQGISRLLVKTNGWNKGGLYSQSPGSFQVSGQLGGQSGYQTYVEELRSLGIPCAPAVCLSYYYNDRGFDGYSGSRDTARFVDKSLVSLYQRNPVDWSDDTASLRSEVCSPKNYLAYVNRYIESDAVNSGYLSVGKFGMDINSDFNIDSYYDRTRAQAEIIQSLDALRNSGAQLIGEDANAYALPYLSVLDGVETASSGHVIYSQSVPFKQMVLHGHVEYTVPSISQQLDWETLLLNCIETGSGLHIQLIGEPSENLEGTSFSYLNQFGFERFREELTNLYQELDAALSGLGSHTIINHETIDEGVVLTEYDNGESIVVNYTDSEVTVSGKTLGPCAYLRF